MANAVAEISGIEIANVAKISGKTDADIQAIGGREFAGVTDAHTLITTVTVPADSSSPVGSIDFTANINSTYDVYEFVCTSLHPASSGVALLFQVNQSDDEDGDYDATPMSTTMWQSYHTEDNSGTPTVAYSSGNHSVNATGTGRVKLINGLVNDADSSASGTVMLFDPSSTIYNKHALSRFNFQNSSGPHYSTDTQVTVLIGDATADYDQAVTQVRFMMSSGNIDAGEIKMYGLAIS